MTSFLEKEWQCIMTHQRAFPDKKMSVIMHAQNMTFLRTLAKNLFSS